MNMLSGWFHVVVHICRPSSSMAIISIISTGTATFIASMLLTGEELYREKMGQTRSFTASPVASDGNLFIVDDEGTVYVVKAGPTYELVGTSELGGISMTAPALTDGIIFFRTVDKLIAVGK